MPEEHLKYFDGMMLFEKKLFKHVHLSYTILIIDK
jgi:hypothetical protein